MLTAIKELSTKPERARASLVDSERLSYIDTLRGLACFAVLLVHVHAYWLHDLKVEGLNLTNLVLHIAGYGFTGVDLFIVLSGFCLFYPTITNDGGHKPFSTKFFYLRRVLRLLPPYYAVLIPTIAAFLISPWITEHCVARHINGFDIAVYLLLIQAFFKDTVGSINGSYWSIALEMQLYLVFPLVLSVTRKRGVSDAIALGVVTVVAYNVFCTWYMSQPAFEHFGGRLIAHLPAHLVQFIFGMTAAWCVKNPKPSHTAVALTLLVITFPIAIISIPKMFPLAAKSILWGIAFSSIVVLFSKLPNAWFIGFRPLTVFTKLGVISYSLYLIHQPLILMTEPLARSLNLTALETFGFFLIGPLPLMAALATILYWLVERPCLNYAKAIENRTRKSTSVKTIPR